MPRRVTRIVVTELPPDVDNPEPWLTEWTADGEEYRQRHDSRAAARRLVGNLLTQASGREVLTVRRLPTNDESRPSEEGRQGSSQGDGSGHGEVDH